MSGSNIEALAAVYGAVTLKVAARRILAAGGDESSVIQMTVDDNTTGGRRVIGEVFVRDVLEAFGA